MTGFSAADVDALRDLLNQAAKREIMPRFRRLERHEVSEKNGPQDLVTEADTAAEAAIEAGLRALFPEAAIIGEEGAEQDPSLPAQIADADLAFIIDPIDGTWNFAHGVPLFGVMLAATRRGETVLGLIHDPVHGATLIAERGGGARDCAPDGGETPLRAAAPDAFEDMTGCIENALGDRELRARLFGQFAIFGRCANLLCSAHDYRLLANGAAAFALNSSLKPWDHAAGALIFAEAGGKSALLDSGAPYAPTLSAGRLLSAATPELWDRLQAHFLPALTPR